MRSRTQTHLIDVDERLEIERLRLEMIVEYYMKNPKRFKAIYDHPRKYPSGYEHPNSIIRYPNIRRMETVLSMFDTPGGLLLDAGCGDGIYGVELAKRGFSVVSMELCWIRTKQAKDNFDQNNILSEGFVVGDIQHLPFNEKSFDVVLCSEVLEHTPDYEQAIQEVGRVLKRSGSAIFTTPILECLEVKFMKILSPSRYKWLLLWLMKADYPSHLHNFNLDHLLERIRDKNLVTKSVRCVPTIYIFFIFLTKLGFSRLAIMLDRALSKSHKRSGRYAVIKARRD